MNSESNEGVNAPQPPQYTPSFSNVQPNAQTQSAVQPVQSPTQTPVLNIDKPVVSKSTADKLADIISLTYFGIAFILLFRFVLSLVGANQETVFVNFIYQISTPFMIPFMAMFGTPIGIQEYRLEMEVLVALLVYAAILFGIVKLIRILFR